MPNKTKTVEEVVPLEIRAGTVDALTVKDPDPPVPPPRKSLQKNNDRSWMTEEQRAQFEPKVEPKNIEKETENVETN